MQALDPWHDRRERYAPQLEKPWPRHRAKMRRIRDAGTLRVPRSMNMDYSSAVFRKVLISAASSATFNASRPVVGGATIARNGINGNAVDVRRRIR